MTPRKVAMAAGLTRYVTGKPCPKGHVGERHIDHVMPLRLGGSNYIENIQLLCRPCNLSKGSKHPAVWLAAMLGNGGGATQQPAAA